MTYLHLRRLFVGSLIVAATLATQPASAAPVPGCVPLFKAISSQPAGTRLKTYQSAAYNFICERTQMMISLYHDVNNCGYADIQTCTAATSPVYTLGQNCGNYDPCAH